MWICRLVHSVVLICTRFGISFSSPAKLALQPNFYISQLISSSYTKLNSTPHLCSSTKPSISLDIMWAKFNMWEETCHIRHTFRLVVRFQWSICIHYVVCEEILGNFHISLGVLVMVMISHFPWSPCDGNDLQKVFCSLMATVLSHGHRPSIMNPEHISKSETMGFAVCLGLQFDSLSVTMELLQLQCI
jgi:hypothetical protein